MALLEILVCPETHQSLHLAQPDFLKKLNGKIQAGLVRNAAGQQVVQALEEGLIREDGQRLYPVHHGIPIMLIDEAIPLEETGSLR